MTEKVDRKAKVSNTLKDLREDSEEESETGLKEEKEEKWEKQDRRERWMGYQHPDSMKIDTVDCLQSLTKVIRFSHYT